MMMKLACVVLLFASVTTLVNAECVGENGDTYPDNTGPYPAGDGCNLCHCKDGNLECTDNSCGCRDYMNDVWVSEGSSVVSREGCLKCTCSGGELDCEHMGCGCRKGNGQWVEDGASYRPDCNTCYCTNLHGMCTLMGCSGCYTATGYRAINETWAGDDCNSCTCQPQEDGSVFGAKEVCTRRVCPQIID